MCGRFVVSRVGSELVGTLRADIVGDDLPAPSFNVAPTDRAAIVLDSATSDPPVRRVESARWGLVPGWAKDPSSGARAINARAEEAAGKRMFSSSLQRRRAIVPVTGYYEWRRGPSGKTPYFITPADGSPMLLAGLYAWWGDRGKPDDDPDRWLLSFTILTRSPVGTLETLHDRMPLVMDPGHADAWLDPSPDHARDVLDAVRDATEQVVRGLELYPVSSAVGNVRNDGPELIDPAGTSSPAWGGSLDA